MTESRTAEATIDATTNGNGHSEREADFVAINYITCEPEFRERFEEMFRTRKQAIDSSPGFRFMEVLRPDDDSDSYLIVSHWDSAEAFKDWTKSEAFVEGHRRGFAALDEAKREGKKKPMSSRFRTYKVFAR